MSAPPPPTKQKKISSYQWPNDKNTLPERKKETKVKSKRKREPPPPLELTLKGMERDVVNNSQFIVWR